MTPNPISRRNALKAAVLAATSLFAPAGTFTALAQGDDPDPFNPGGRVNVKYDETASFNHIYDNPPLLGRSESWGLRIVAEPDDKSKFVRTIGYDDVAPIYRSVRGKAPAALKHNDIWYDVGDGYIHSSYIVPVHEVFNPVVENVGKGFWGEITVPTSWQHWEPKLRSRRYFDFAYGTMFKVIDKAAEPDGREWYRLIDDLTGDAAWWVQATHVRPVGKAEFAAISPEVPAAEKLIHVSIGDQVLTCYERGKSVFETRIASGASFFDPNGVMHSFGTPWGHHKVEWKMPSRRMVGGEIINDEYDLPGVPWCCFFTASGAAVHGTYWHNDYGRPRSHGCVNVTSDAAKWVYRWANPYAGYDEPLHQTTRAEADSATSVVVER
jgi:hypothetical protein